MEITAQMGAENARLAKQQRKVEILANSWFIYSNGIRVVMYE